MLALALLNIRAQVLRESRGGLPGLPVLNGPYGFCERKATLNLNLLKMMEQQYKCASWPCPALWEQNFKCLNSPTGPRARHFAPHQKRGNISNVWGLPKSGETQNQTT